MNVFCLIICFLLEFIRNVRTTIGEIGFGRDNRTKLSERVAEFVNKNGHKSEGGLVRGLVLNTHICALYPYIMLAIQSEI